MKISVEREKCLGYANCIDAFPENFEIGDDGIAIVQRPVIGPESREKAERATRLCPAGAIRLSGEAEDVTGPGSG